MTKLDNIDQESTDAILSPDDLIAVRRQLLEGQTLLRETVDRLRQSQEENEKLTRRRDDLESRVTTLETEYEELLGTCEELHDLTSLTLTLRTEKTIHDEEVNNVDVGDLMADLKVCQRP